jgi:hypothetical protein
MSHDSQTSEQRRDALLTKLLHTPPQSREESREELKAKRKRKANRGKTASRKPRKPA